MRAIHNDENNHVNNASLAHWARKNGYRRAFHSYKDYRRHCSNAAGNAVTASLTSPSFANANNRQENTQIRNNKSPTLMARMRVLKNPRHLFFLSGFFVSLGALIAFLLVTDRSRLAELAIGMIHR